MRPLKFRAWDDVAKKWLLGHDYPNLGGFSLFGETMIFGEWAQLAEDYIFERNGHKGTDLKVVQYIGIRDKNGKEIYEDDIVSGTVSGSPSHVCEGLKLEGKVGQPIVGYIKYSSMYAQFYFTTNDITYLDLLLGLHDIEIIGNLHETPELLTA